MKFNLLSPKGRSPFLARMTIGEPPPCEQSCRGCLALERKGVGAQRGAGLQPAQRAAVVPRVDVVQRLDLAEDLGGSGPRRHRGGRETVHPKKNGIGHRGCGCVRTFLKLLILLRSAGAARWRRGEGAVREGRPQEGSTPPVGRMGTTLNPTMAVRKIKIPRAQKKNYPPPKKRRLWQKGGAHQDGGGGGQKPFTPNHSE